MRAVTGPAALAAAALMTSGTAVAQTDPSPQGMPSQTTETPTPGAQTTSSQTGTAAQPPSTQSSSNPSYFRLQGSAFARAQPGTALLIMRGSGEVDSWVSVDALVWGGFQGQGKADVLVVSARMRDPGGRGEGQIGRFVIGPGAIRPIHIDGAAGLVRLPGDVRLEAFGGVPVAPEFDNEGFGWVLGGRASRGLGDWGSVGLAYAHRQHDGEVADEEIGADLGLVVTDWLDLNGKVAYDLVNPGISEILGTLTFHEDDWRASLFYTERSPSRILPSTSLFSVLGDVASRRAAMTVDYRVAPRLDVNAVAGVRWIGADASESLRGRAELRLNDEGTSSLTGELRREAAPDGDWTGLRTAARVRIMDGLTAATEVELVIPDEPQGRGKVWPWALIGLEWLPVEEWKVAAGALTSASPQLASRTDVLVRVTHQLEGP